MKNNEARHRFVELRARGISFGKIAKELKIAKSEPRDYTCFIRYI